MGSPKGKPHPPEVSGGPAETPGEDPFRRQRPLPLDRSVFWYPVDQDSEGNRAQAYLRFISLGVLRAIAQQVGARPKEGRLGFLIGELFVCPDTNTRYVVAETTLTAPHPLRGDRTLQAVTLAWPRLQEQLKLKRRHLIGWYHTHPEGGFALTPSDETTHLRFFPQPWQMAIVLKPGFDVPHAIVCRPGTRGSSTAALLPFYELLEPQSLLAEGVRLAYFKWDHYRTDAAERGLTEVSAVDALAPPETHSDDDLSSARVIMPNELDHASHRKPSGGPRRPTRGESHGRIRRFGVAAAIMLAAALVLWKVVPWGSRPGAVSVLANQTTSQVDPTLARLDELADEVARVVLGYQERASLFDNRQMTCADLARGMAQVDEGWRGYNVEGRSEAGTLDPDRAERDETLYAQVLEVERHFRASGCPDS